MLNDLNKYNTQTFKQFSPGHLIELNYSANIAKWEIAHSQHFSSSISVTNPFIDSSNVLNMIQKSLISAVEKRVDNTERPIACLLSGGLDSSLIAALVKNIHKGELHTWSIGFEGSDDLKYAQIHHILF